MKPRTVEIDDNCDLTPQEFFRRDEVKQALDIYNQRESGRARRAGVAFTRLTIEDIMTDAGKQDQFYNTVRPYIGATQSFEAFENLFATMKRVREWTRNLDTDRFLSQEEVVSRLEGMNIDILERQAEKEAFYRSIGMDRALAKKGLIESPEGYSLDLPGITEEQMQELEAVKTAGDLSGVELIDRRIPFGARAEMLKKALPGQKKAGAFKKLIGSKPLYELPSGIVLVASANSEYHESDRAGDIQGMYYQTWQPATFELLHEMRTFDASQGGKSPYYQNEGGHKINDKTTILGNTDVKGRSLVMTGDPTEDFGLRAVSPKTAVKDNFRRLIMAIGNEA